MEEKKTKSSKKLFTLLKELAAVQADNKKVKRAIKRKRFKEKIQKLVDDYNKSKIGRNALHDIDEKLAKLQEKYEEGLNEFTDRIETLETCETDIQLEMKSLKDKTSEIKQAQEFMADKYEQELAKQTEITKKLLQAIKDKDGESVQSLGEELNNAFSEVEGYKSKKELAEEYYEKYQQKEKELREELAKVQADITKVKEEQAVYEEENEDNITIEYLKDKRETIEGLIPKQNAWQKMWGAIYSKFSRDKKDEKDEEKKPKKETPVKEKKEGVIKKSINSIVEFAKARKLAMIERAERALDKKQKENENLKAKLEGKDIGEEKTGEEPEGEEH